MGTFRNGGNGAFSGKTGSFIGSNWSDINYIKGIPRISNKPKTQKQLEQQAKFALAVRFLRPVKLQWKQVSAKSFRVTPCLQSGFEADPDKRDYRHLPGL